MARGAERRRHPDDRALLRAGLLRLGPVSGPFRDDPRTTWLERAGQDDQDALVNPDAAELCTKASASRDEVLSAAAESGAILTVEEHNVTGGLGSAVAETLLDAAARVLFVKHGVPDCYVGVGPPAALYAHYRLDVPGTTEVARALLSRAMPGDPA